MRIGLITPGFSASEADWCIPALLALVRELARHAEVEVFTLRYPHRRGSYAVYGATVHAFGGGLAAGVSRLALLGSAMAAIVRRHRRRRFDVLHGLWADEPGFLAVAAGRLIGVPSVVSLMGGELVGLRDIDYGGQLSRAGRYLTRRSLRGASCTTVGSSYLASLARPHVAPGRLRPLPLGVDTALFRPAAQPAAIEPRPSGRHNLLHVASLVPIKDQAMLLRALALAAKRRRDVHLHIVGSGPLRGRLEAQARSLEIGDQLTFHGEVSHERLPAYYGGADLQLLSSRYESQSMVALEAAACGRPTIGTAVGLLPDLGPASRTVPIGDAPALADALCSVLDRPEQLAEMGTLSLEAVTTRYALEHTVAATRALYDELRGR